MGSGSVQAKQSQPSARERLSAFADGEGLDGTDIGQFLAGFTNQDRTTWSDFHLIGDALRSDDLAARPEASSAFMNAFSARFESEAHVFAPAAIPAVAPAVAARANVFRRRMVPAFAVAAAAATLTWIVVPQLQGIDTHSGLQISSIGTDNVQRVALSTSPVKGQPIVEANIIRDASLDQYLEAHQQFSQQPVMPGSMPLMRASAVSQGQ